MEMSWLFMLLDEDKFANTIWDRGNGLKPTGKLLGIERA
jgi:hypothetical protein